MEPGVSFLETGEPETAEQIVALIRRERPTCSGADLSTPFEQLGIDSFDMLTFRVELERLIGASIDDPSRSSLPPISCASFLPVALARGAQFLATPAAARRVFSLNMPQMALGGMSESWLFKEIGDIHWNVIMNGLRMPSSQLKDAGGDRLYATFTRFQLNFLLCEQRSQ